MLTPIRKDNTMARTDAYTRAAGPRSATTAAPGQVANHGGGYSHVIDEWEQARRFLIIGTTGGTYYQGEAEYTRENLDVLVSCANSDPARLAELIADVSERGLAPKVSPAIAALALMTSLSTEARAAAYPEFGRVIRTGSHLLAWARYHKAFGGKVNRAWRRTVSSWMLDRDPDKLAYQLAKYRQRDGWSMKDLIDMSHALSGSVGGEDAWRTRGALKWARGEEVSIEQLPMLLNAVNGVAKGEGSALEALGYGLSWEMLPDKWLRDPKIWASLLEGRSLPMTAALRNLPRMTEIGAIDQWFRSPAAHELSAMFSNERALRGARIHPINLLMAQKAYAKGETRSGLTYRPIPRVIDMLDDAFYKSFETAEASGKRTLIGVDISSSMTMGYNFFGDANRTGLTPHEIATVLAMKILRTEPASHVVGFASSIRELGMTPRMTLPEALRTTQGSFGATNPSALIAYASQHRIEVDTFVVITDNEVNRGFNVAETLRAYRGASGINAKLIVLACTATNFSIADPNDAGMLDVAGFGADVPALITEFSRA